MPILPPAHLWGGGGADNSSSVLNDILLGMLMVKTVYVYTYQSTDARLMQSENGILLLFYIFLSHGNEKKGGRM